MERNIIGQFRKFDGKEYKLRATASRKGSLMQAQKRWGAGRIVRLPKTSIDYKQGSRYGLYLEA